MLAKQCHWATPRSSYLFWFDYLKPRWLVVESNFLKIHLKFNVSGRCFHLPNAQQLHVWGILWFGLDSAALTHLLLISSRLANSEKQGVRTHAVSVSGKGLKVKTLWREQAARCGNVVAYPFSMWLLNSREVYKNKIFAWFYSQYRVLNLVYRFYFRWDVYVKY